LHFTNLQRNLYRQEEPHRTRRQEIIKAHPEVSKLCGPEPLTKYVVLFVVLLQITTAYILRNTPVLSLKFLGTAYIIGATANQNLFLAIHELSHNLGFKSPTINKIFSIFANLPIGVPYSAAFRPYHLDHHKYLGVDGIDTDLPTRFEAFLLNNILGKAFFCTFQLLFYAIRPILVTVKPLTWVSYLNLTFQFLFDYIIYCIFGGKALVYLLISSFLAGSLHPCAAHFLSEHYLFDRNDGHRGQETFSYYGPLNILCYNVGYHNEHHDFPYIPWTRLGKLHTIAKEFYEPLSSHKSWSMVAPRFIMDTKVGMWCRVKREQAIKGL